MGNTCHHPVHTKTPELIARAKLDRRTILKASAAFAAAAYLYGGWPARVALGTTIILLAFGISITLGHLAFLDAYALLITPGGLSTPSFTPDQIEEIFRSAF